MYEHWNYNWFLLLNYVKYYIQLKSSYHLLPSFSMAKAASFLLVHIEESISVNDNPQTSFVALK